MADDESKQIGQDEIEELLRQSRGPAPASAEAAKPAPAAKPTPAAKPAEATVGQDDIDALLNAPGDAPGGAPPKAPAAKSAAANAPAAATPADGDSSKLLGQADIEALLGNAAAAAPKPTPTGPAPKLAPAPAPVDEGLATADIELLLRQAEAALASVDQPADAGLPPGFSPFQLEDFSGAPPSSEMATLELIRDVELDLKIELGRTHMYLEEVLKLRKGSVVPLDKLAGDPVDIYVNGRLIARGEVLVLNDNFCVRVAELIAGESPLVH